MKSIESRLRTAAVLLMSLPSIVASACFAHGHGSLSSLGLLAVLAATIAAGVIAADFLFGLARGRATAADSCSNSTGSLPAAVSHHS
ncbi:MAG TPA: hypothetical protein VJM11_08120 [Nevskiaceae bacterium]|nr:hypothetical protein [Nevskiaceae bacterium]